MRIENVTNCVFCTIADRTNDAHIVFEDELTICFLDNRPLFPGHCLLIPRQHIQTIENAGEELGNTLFRNLRTISIAVEKGSGSEGTFMAINNKVSQSIPHLHIHIVPRNKKDGLRGFFWPRNPYRDEEHMQDICKKIKTAIEKQLQNTQDLSPK